MPSRPGVTVVGDVEVRESLLDEKDERELVAISVAANESTTSTAAHVPLSRPLEGRPVPRLPVDTSELRRSLRVAEVPLVGGPLVEA